MTLEELKIIIDSEINNLKINNLNGKQPKDIEVLINLSESSMGARASTKIKYIGMGFDWECGQLRIEPIQQLVKKGNALTDIKNVIQKEFQGRKYYVCPHCGQKISKQDFYCRYCGQKLK